MPTVTDYGSCQILAPHSRFPHVDSPFYTHTDFPWQSGVATWAQNFELIADYDLQAIYPAPVRVPHSQGEGYYGGDGGLSIGWQDYGSVPMSFRTNPLWNLQEFHVKQARDVAHLGLFDVWAPVACQGVTFMWSRLEQGAADDPGANPPFTTFRVGVGVGLDLVLYSVRFGGDGSCKIAKSYDGGVSFYELETVAVNASSSAMGYGLPDLSAAAASPDPTEEPGDAPFEYNLLEVRLIAGRISFRIGAQGQTFVYDEARVGINGNSIWQISSLAIRATKFVALAASAHITKWTAYSVYDSPEIPIGFYSEAVRSPYIDPAGVVPFGWNAFVDGDVSYLFGPICAYRMVLAGPVDGNYRGTEFSHTAAAVRAINLFWAPQITFRPAAPLAMPIETLEVRHSFDPNTLQIASQGIGMINNNRARFLPTGEFGWWGEWMREYGQTGVDCFMTRTDANDVWGPLTRVFAGYGNAGQPSVVATPQGSYYKFTMHDRRRQLANCEFALPWMDGWNVYYAIAFLAQLGGVDISDMTFAPYVPPVPFGPGSNYGSPEGGAYYLPVGQAGSTLTRFSGLPNWDVMSRIAYAIGYMLFFDVNGQLQFRKFRVVPGVKRTFFESDGASYFQPGGGLEGCATAEVVKDMDEIRNISVTIGVNAFAPRYDPVVYKYVDVASIYDPSAFNHLGYKMAAVWMDSQFANPNFAQFAAGAMFNFLRYPGYYVKIRTNWLQPDIFPLDMIGLHSIRLGTGGLRFLVTDVIHTVTKDPGFSTIYARFVPDVLG